MGMIQAPMLAAASGSDVDFMVHGLIPLNFFGHKVWITTTHVTTLIVMLFIMVLALKPLPISYNFKTFRFLKFLPADAFL